MKIIRIPAGIYQTNCYLAFDPDTKEGFLVDPAGDPGLLLQHIEEQEAVIKAILLTHGHGDHIGAVAEMREAFDVPVYAHEDEKALLEDPVQNQSKSMFHGPCTVEADVFVTDGEVIPVSGGVQVIHTPGHTAGGVCYLVSGNVFSHVSKGHCVEAHPISRYSNSLLHLNRSTLHSTPRASKSWMWRIRTGNFALL